MYGDKTEEDLEVGGDIHPCLQGLVSAGICECERGDVQNAPPKSLRTTQGQGSRVCSKAMMMVLPMWVDDIRTGLAENKGGE
jgi:hypothetical protein